jgi:hypothetical protein
MTTELLLSRLDGVKRTGSGRWLARCPAHEDRKASLAVRELDDGQTLAHCFAGCDVSEVIAAAGLTMDALFPPRASDHRQRGARRPFPATDVLRAIEAEALVVAVAGASLGNGGALGDEDRARLLLASTRITDALEVSHAGR